MIDGIHKFFLSFHERDSMHIESYKHRWDVAEHCLWMCLLDGTHPDAVRVMVEALIRQKVFGTATAETQTQEPQV